MASPSRNARQERQLVLMERISTKIDAIEENQKRLEEQNQGLQQENAKLRSELERQKEAGTRRRSRSSRSQSQVEIPNDLRKRFRFIYKKMVEKGVHQGFSVDAGPQSEGNQALLTKMKGILKKEHGGENCQWTDLQIDAQYLRYFKTIKERKQRIQKATNEEHKDRCKRGRRLLSKLERRCSGFDLLKPTLSAKEKKYFEEVLYIDYMSSEESEFEDEQDPITGETSTKLVGFVTRKLPWERTNLTNAKMRLDRAHQKNLTPHARQMAKPRRVGGDSDRPRPDGPGWAVRPPPAASE